MLRLVVAALTLLVLPSALALSVSDPARDEYIDMADAQRVEASGQFPEVDLLGATLTEDAANLYFVITAAAYPIRPVYESFVSYFDAQFDVSGRLHDLGTFGCLRDQFMLGVFAPGAPFSSKVACVPFELQSAGINVTVPKALLRTSEGVPPKAGDAVRLIDTRAYHPVVGILGGEAVMARDEVEPADATLVLTKGHLSLAGRQLAVSPLVRVGNGAERLLVWQVDVLPGERSVDLQAVLQGLPAGWSTHAPAAIHAGETGRLFVVAAAPMSHRHGDGHDLTLHLAAGDDALQVPLRMEYHAVPQPAGHHPRMWLHGREDPAYDTGMGITLGRVRTTWFNAVLDDPRDQGTTADVAQSDGSYAHWRLRLDPSLLIGLDGDPERPGLASIVFVGGSTGIQGSLQARVQLCDASDPSGQASPDCPTGSLFDFATGDAPIDVGAGEALTVEVPLRLQERGDYAPVAAGDNLFLVLDARATLPVFMEERLQPSVVTAGSTIDLPLLEFSNHAAILQDNNVVASLEVPAQLDRSRHNLVVSFAEPLQESVTLLPVGATGGIVLLEAGTVQARVPIAAPDLPAGAPVEGALVVVGATGQTFGVLPFRSVVAEDAAAGGQGGTGPTRDAPAAGVTFLALAAVAVALAGRSEG